MSAMQHDILGRDATWALINPVIMVASALQWPAGEGAYMRVLAYGPTCFHFISFLLFSSVGFFSSV